VRSALVIGEGLLGCALIDALAEGGYKVSGSSRDVLSSKLYIDLTKPIPQLPQVDVVYICAAIATYRGAEFSPQIAWLVNADAPVTICQQCIDRGMFPVFVSTDAIEWLGFTEYGRGKTYAELGVRLLGGAVVRPAKFTPANVGSLCHLMIRVGLDRKPGVYRWA
jgi:nucleoside-diphosphate-sugar epimerase